MTSRIPRRSLLLGAAGGVAAMTTSTPVSARAAGFVRSGRLTLPSGVQTGDVSGDRAVLWARSSGPGELRARLSTGRRSRLLRGPLATPESDGTARINLSGLRAGRDYVADLWFEDERGARGEVGRVRFSTPGRGAQSFVWTGDTCGQGWGINPDVGGMTAYAAMHATRPDFFLHAGDTIYADGPIAESVTEPDGQVWRNLVTPEVAKVAETLTEFRGRHAYNLMDHNVRAFYADTPLISQWDDHETHNNWYPGQLLANPAYTEKRVDVLARRARQAWQEFQPIDTSAVRRRGRTGFAEARIYRKISRGHHLDVFCLDMRTNKSANTEGLETHETPILGEEQVAWLLRQVSRSRATWKVISADMPLGVVVPDGTEGQPHQESISNGDDGAPLGREFELARLLRGLKGIPGVVWVTADVHYCAANHYAPERAAFTDFDPFWEFVAGPINAGTFGPNELDGTFGPEAVFVKAADYPNQSPRGGNQFFGHMDIDDDGLLTVSLRNGAGTVLWSRELDPASANR